jgi:hypothetical protein
MLRAHWLLFVTCALLLSATQARAQQRHSYKRHPPKKAAPAAPAASSDEPDPLAEPTGPEPAAVPGGDAASPEPAPAPAAPVAPEHAAAAGGDDVIQDPELAGSIAPARAAASSGDGLIDDPELAGTAPSKASFTDSSSSSAPDPGDVRLVLHTRLWRDLHVDDPREEILDSTTVAAMEATVRRSDSLRFSIGVVASYHYASLANDVPDAPKARYEFDAMPTSAYVDATITSGLNVRLGYQPVHLGRFDAFSATNVLSVYDVRQGPATLPEVPEIGQFAALTDWDIAGWLSLRAIYIPFFTPNIVSVFEGDYALVPLRQANINQAFESLSQLVGDNARQWISSNLSRADRERIATSALSAFAPAPSLMYPQGALRVSTHGSAGELAATFSTALEHTPAFRLSNEALMGLSEMPPTLPTDSQPITVEYNRFAAVSIDGAIDVSPFSIGAELAYQFHRTLYAVGVATSGQYAIAQPDFTDIAQGGLRIEYTQSAHWLFALEGFGMYAIQAPSDPHRGWLFLQRGAWAYGAGGLLGYSADFGLHLELGGTFFTGPSGIVSPRIAYTIVDGFDAEVGGLFIFGPTPPVVGPGPPPVYSTPNIAIGGILNNVDHVYVGLRYRP